MFCLEELESRLDELKAKIKIEDAKAEIKLTKSDIIKFINEHISEPITLSTVSEKVNLTKEYVSHIFKKETGKTVTDYINERKMIIAKEMILGSHYELYEISERMGYDNYSYFSKLFKKQFGASPSAMRK